MKEQQPQRWGDEAPEWRHFIIVLVVVGLLIALGWITWFKFGWFH
jgi:hypothetical protein